MVNGVSTGAGEFKGPALRFADPRRPWSVEQSYAVVSGVSGGLPDVLDWIADKRGAQNHRVSRIPFGAMRNWHFEDDTGDLRHDSGRFFSIQGLAVETDFGTVRSWSQPIINQPEIGILGILVKEFDGVLHCLMQAKSEPGNLDGVQLSPTVQATWSNYSGVHRGREVPYLAYFRDPPPADVLTDVLQSEQGSWFYRKRNRNMIVQTTDDVPLLDDFRWLTFGQIQEMLRIDNLVNMDTRTVLSCAPADGLSPGDDWGSLLTETEMLSWITTRQAEYQLHTRPMPLASVRSWTRTEDVIAHERGLYFRIIAVDVSTDSREVDSWSQPLIAPHGRGVIALLVKRVDGVLHALFNARVEPGYLDVVELAPTVQCTPENYAHLSQAERPPFLDVVLAARPEDVLFDTEMSEEGGRFYEARNRYLVIQVDEDFPDDVWPDFRWLTLHQTGRLLQHSHYVNVQARSLIACMRGLR
ncbi:oxidase EvaA [Actinoalloteichus hoggarensis]|uniref:NDP-hexose 2,3-dehydratase n=1 Tax=Actinoalloteichus hoggarensis TaxID=1470176 RepID=A0A221W496_9PSEU|nr:NDP-hexose 2,3-dehydratase family protein [Actinoalloteichus hoggarensis]ASO20658.1 NDP-hexose 2,3-dehydratase [Actinoalloteichus hoggarensis]MBB5924489.1 oxidase EvaA [Actinoalloteichus hoggarensis]